MSNVVRQWIERVREETDANERDRLVYAEATDRRLGYPRQVVVGAVVDGRPHKPGVILAHLVEGDPFSYSECGVSTIEHARAVIEALHMAWPELRGGGAWPERPAGSCRCNVGFCAEHAE